MTEDRRAALAREIAEFSRPPTLAEDEITIRDYAEAVGVDWMTAKSDLARQERAGKLTKRQAYDVRVKRTVAAYRRAAG